MLRVRHREALATAGATGQVTALSLLVSMYLQSVYAASSEEIEIFLSPVGLALAGAGSGARLVRHAADPFPFDGRADLLLPRRRLAGVRRPAVLRGLLRLGDALPDARPLLFAPNQEDRGRGDPDDRDQDPDQDRNQDEPDLDSDQDGRMDDPVARRVPRAPAILPAGRLGLLLPAKPIARQPGHPLPHPPGRRNRGSGQARPQLGRVADRAENQRVSLAGNQAESPAAGLAGNRAGDQAGDRVENRAVGHRATFRRANPRVRSQEHEREAKLAAGSRD
jgi:hypothetical protein